MTLEELEQKKERLNKDDLLDLIKNQVYKSRELAEGSGDYNIRRGMAHAIPGYCEDVFALYVAKYLGRNDLKYFVDKVISVQFEGEKKATSFKPDLAIVNENNVLTHYFDLKTNLGWNRNLKGYLAEKEKFVGDLIMHKKAWITSKQSWLNKLDKDGNEILFNKKYPVEGKLNITISEDLKYHMVVVYGGNMNEKEMNDNKTIASKSKYLQIDVLKSDGKINDDAFKNIHESLQDLKKK